MSPWYQTTPDRSNRNLLWLQPFLQAPSLPFANVLSEEDVDAAMAAEGVEFGQLDGSVYTPALTTWAWLSQVLHTGLMRSCAAAVSRIIVLLVALGQDPCAEDTSAYCRARQKLPEAVIRRLAVEVSQELEAQVPADWLWHGRHVKLADGTTLTMPDTDANRAAYPQNPVQKPGLGFPILRMVVLLSLATGLLCDMAVGPYAGKETGENALLRTLWDAFQPGDILLGDRLYCSYCQVALAQQHHVDSVVRLHQGRRADFRRGVCLARGDRVVEWQRPPRPEWMDEATYATIPQTLHVRQIRIEVQEPGFRPEKLVVVTTLLDANRYPMQDVARLYHYRWNAELDLCVLKQSLAMDHLRCKSPEMVRKEIWMAWLAYNLTRKTIAQAALLHGKLPRQIGFCGAVQAIAASWDRLSDAPASGVGKLAMVQFEVIASHNVGDRPGRVEPRAVKRRGKPRRLLMQPRDTARQKLLAARRKGR
jgi:putative transposase